MGEKSKDPKVIKMQPEVKKKEEVRTLSEDPGMTPEAKVSYLENVAQQMQKEIIRLRNLLNEQNMANAFNQINALCVMIETLTKPQLVLDEELGDKVNTFVGRCINELIVMNTPPQEESKKESDEQRKQQDTVQ